MGDYRNLTIPAGLRQRRISPGGPRAIKDTPSRWMLVPRTIPLMEDKLERFSRVARASGVETPPEFLQGARPVTLPANSMHRCSSIKVT